MADNLKVTYYNNGYEIPTEYSNEELAKMSLYIEVAKQKYPVIVEITPLKNKQARFL